MKKIITLSILFAFSSVTAEIHPKYYHEMQQEAPIVISATVLQVHRGPVLTRIRGRKEPISLDLRVDSISRGKDLVEEGQRLTVRYSRFNPPKGWVGPRIMPLLREGEKTEAWLATGKDDSFVPAARGWSFERVEYIEENNER